MAASSSAGPAVLKPTENRQEVEFARRPQGFVTTERSVGQAGQPEGACDGQRRAIAAQARRSIPFRQAIGHSLGLATACLVSYWLITAILTHLYSVSRSDDLLGGMWAVVATAFVYRSSYHQKQ
jgi:hypothetical protein